MEKEIETKELNDDEFLDSLLNDGETKKVEPEVDEEEAKKKALEEAELEKNRNAEAARKRREAVAKAEAEKKAKALAEKEAKEKAEKDVNKKEEEDAEAKKLVKEKEERSARQNALGEQLQTFKGKYPDVDLGKLDNDKNFKRFIDGKVLGKKDFTALYEDFVDFKAEVGSVEKEAILKNHRKSNSSSGSAKGGNETPAEIYSEEELRKMADKLPFMSRKDAAKVEERINKSIAYYDKK